MPVGTNNLKPDTKIAVSGIMEFSRITSQINGQELKDDIDRATKAGIRYPTTKPYTKVLISNPVVRCQNPAVYAGGTVNPDLMSPAERFVFDHCYNKKTEVNGPKYYQAQNVGKFLPWVAKRVDAQSVAQINPEGEIAKGVPVTLILRVFASNSGNNGLSLDGIICDGEPQWYNPGVADLSDLGLSFHADPTINREAAATTPGQPQAQPQFIPQQQPQIQPAPQVQPQAPQAPAYVPQPNPYTVQPQAPAQAPVMPPQFTPQAPAAPAQGNPGVAVPQPNPYQAQPFPMPPAPPAYNPNAGTVPAIPGITYNPGNDPERQNY